MTITINEVESKVVNATGKPLTAAGYYFTAEHYSQLIKKDPPALKGAATQVSYTKASSGLGVPTFMFLGPRIVNIPDPVPGLVFIVSREVFSFCTWRSDFITPFELTNDTCKGFELPGRV